jgi:hypothetical protein
MIRRERQAAGYNARYGAAVPRGRKLQGVIGYLA